LSFALCWHFCRTNELSCYERDHCNRTIIEYRSMNESDLIKQRNCFCDRACFQYDDCCEDIKQLSRQQQSIRATCVDYMYPFRVRSEIYTQTVMPIWMITTCLSNYRYTQLERNCSNAFNDSWTFSDPSIYVPMTSKQTNLTYRNIYCALCNNEQTNFLVNWSFQIVCTGLKQNYLFTYEIGMNMLKLPPREAERCINRLSFPPSPAIVYPCKQQTINSCPKTTRNRTLIDLCSNVNAYRYVTRSHPISYTREYSLYRNSFCLLCHNLTADEHTEIDCEHQLDDELIIDPKPKTGRHGVYRLSILFDPMTFSSSIPIRSLKDQQYHASYQTHFNPNYPCRYYEIYDYQLHTCIMLQNEFDWRLIQTFNCTNSILLRYQQMMNNSIVFFSKELNREHADFVQLFSDAKKIIVCGERFPLIYIHHNRFITTIRYSSTLISLLAFLIFMISFTQRSSLHNLPGKCLLVFSICLCLSQTMFLASGHLIEYSNKFWCILSGIGIHLFYLSSFSWLTAISFDTSLALTKMNRLDQRVARNRFIFYNIFAWTFSLIIMFISICLHVTLKENHPWSPNYGVILCSISSRNILILLFLCPIGCLVLLNFIIYTRTIYVVRRIDDETRLARSTHTNRSRSFLYFRLSMVMGIHWIFLLICLIFKYEYLWLLFDLMNSFPGLFIAINFFRKQTTLANIKSKIRSSQSQLSSLGITNHTISSSNVQMNQRLDDITQKLDTLTLHLLKPNTNFHRSSSSL